MMYTYRRIHLPSGREYTGTFNASHDWRFAVPEHFPTKHLLKVMLGLVEQWNRQQPNTWKYWL